jgi:hypothetical protein
MTSRIMSGVKSIGQRMQSTAKTVGSTSEFATNYYNEALQFLIDNQTKYISFKFLKKNFDDNPENYVNVKGRVNYVYQDRKKNNARKKIIIIDLTRIKTIQATNSAVILEKKYEVKDGNIRLKFIINNIDNYDRYDFRSRSDIQNEDVKDIEKVKYKGPKIPINSISSTYNSTPTIIASPMHPTNSSTVTSVKKSTSFNPISRFIKKSTYPNSSTVTSFVNSTRKSTINSPNGISSNNIISPMYASS